MYVCMYVCTLYVRTYVALMCGCALSVMFLTLAVVLLTPHDYVYSGTFQRVYTVPGLQSQEGFFKYIGSLCALQSSLPGESRAVVAVGPDTMSGALPLPWNSHNVLHCSNAVLLVRLLLR